MQNPIARKNIAFRLKIPFDELDPDWFAPDEFGACRDSRGRIRLNLTKKFFADYLPLGGLKRVYREWVQTNEYIRLGLFENGEKIKEVAVLASKRGNGFYRHRLWHRLGWMDEIPDEHLAKIEGGRKALTRVLFISLTYDTELKDSRSAWCDIAVEFNRFLANVRNKFGDISFFRVFESTRGGYPHLHVVILFKEKEFFAFKKKCEKSGEVTWRIPYGEKKKFEKWWHSFVDVQACVSWGGVLRYVKKYVMKLHGSKIDGKTIPDLTEEVAELTLALMWFYHKRAYGVSGDFQRGVLDLIQHCVTKTVQIDFDERPIQEWVFLGIKTAEELGISGNPPPWFVVLWPLSSALCSEHSYA